MVENQYIELFNKFREAIDKHSTGLLNQQRETAAETFQRKGFPNRKLEDYQYSDIVQQFATDFGLNINRYIPNVNPYEAYRCDVTNLSTDLYYLLNDSYNTKYIPENEYSAGVFIGGLNTFAEQHPEIFSAHFGKATRERETGITAFNSMLVQDGFVIYIPDNVVLERPVQLINVLTSRVDLLVNRRLLIIAGKNSQLKLLTCDHTVDTVKFLATQVTEIFAGENSRIDFYELEENSAEVCRLAEVFVQQESSSNVLISNISLKSGYTRNNYYLKLNGENAEGSVNGLVIADRTQHVDNFVFMDHAKPHCLSNQLFKYVLQEESTGVFCGRILVEKDAQKTQAYQSNNNLCTSSDAHMYAKPQLEIYADDVKCSHGLTTGQLDEEALFYLRSRGIPKEEARLMLMQAFTAGVVENIRLEVLKERLYELIEKRFKGEDARCGNCLICK